MTAMSYITHRYTGSTTGLRYAGDDRQLLLEYALTDSIGADGTDAGLPRYLHGMQRLPRMGDQRARCAALRIGCPNLDDRDAWSFDREGDPLERRPRDAFR